MYLRAQKLQLERSGNIQKTNTRNCVIPADILNEMIFPLLTLRDVFVSLTFLFIIIIIFLFIIGFDSWRFFFLMM
jgi:hypothetical protein